MNENRPHQQLAVFDSLLDELSQLATSPQVSSNSFFDQVAKVVETIVDPQELVILAAGPNQALLVVRGEVSGAPGITDWVKPVLPADDSVVLQLIPVSHNVAVTPIIRGQSNWGWIVAVMEGKTVSSLHREILSAVAQIVSEFLTTQQAVNQTIDLNRIQQYSTNVHSSLNSIQVANHIANDGRLLMACERVSVYAVHRNRAKLLAVSAVASFEKRTTILQLQKKLVIAACRFPEPIGSDKPPANKSIGDALGSYQQTSGFPFLFGIPLQAKNRTIGYLLAESTANVNRTEFVRGLSASVPPAVVALANAFRYESVPFRNVLGALGGFSNVFNLSKTAIVFAAILLTAAALTFFQADFKIRIHGELRPVVERSVFASHDGIVQEVMIRHGEKVDRGQALVKIRSPEIELALAKSDGELEKLTKFLDSKNIALNQASSDPNASPAIIGQLTSEISDIEYQLKSLADEKKFLLQQQQDLLLTSPIQGNVITWKVDELLMNKPVRWGDSLVTVADEEGDWQLRFHVPERRIGYLLSAQNENAGKKLEFFFESDPSARFSATISEIGNSTELDPSLGPVAIVNCPAPAGNYIRRHGARVFADVDCGRRSIGFVWTRELIDSIRRRFVFW